MPDNETKGGGLASSLETPENVDGIDRRELLKRLGKYATYTAPAVVAVLVAEKGFAAPVPPAPPPSPPAPH